MRPAEVVRRGGDYLARHGVASPQADAERLMLGVLDVDRASLHARAHGLTTGEAKAYGRALCRRCAGTPLQYLTGEQGFRRLVLGVRPGVFVPRPETEVVVDVALDAIHGIEAPRVADIGTGTGAIALAIAQEHPRAQVWAADRSAEAVALARENAGRLGLSVEVHEGDLLSALPASLRGTLDLVVSNPPYVPFERAPDLPAEVLADPQEAVFGGPAIYERLFEEAFVWLRAGGHVIVEIEESAAATVSSIATASGHEEVAVHPDLNGRDRVVGARRP